MVVLESLQKRPASSDLQGETPSVRDVWDNCGKDEWRPVDENAFSDYVKCHLDIDLRNSGIVALM